MNSSLEADIVKKISDVSEKHYRGKVGELRYGRELDSPREHAPTGIAKPKQQSFKCLLG